MNERVGTRVCIVGAGPAGTLLGNLLTGAGIDSVVLERLKRDEVAARARAGLLEHRTVELLGRNGLASSQPGGAYTQRLKEARLEHLRTMRSFAENFAESYVGIDSPDVSDPDRNRAASD